MDAPQPKRKACHERDTYKGSQYCAPCGDEIGEMMSEYDRNDVEDMRAESSMREGKDNESTIQ